MILREIQLPKFIVASFAFHLFFFGFITILNTPETRPQPLEISFGTGNSRGGSGPKLAQPAAPKVNSATAVKKSSAPKVAPQRASNPDAPVIAQSSLPIKESSASETNTEVPSTLEESSGLGTTSGTGSGFTSGSGAGFNDPKIRYRGEIYQLVNSKKVYPRKARTLQQEGTVIAKLKLSKDGKLLNLEIVEESKFKILTKATIDAIKSIKQFPIIPNEMGLNEITINIPFEYEIRHGDVL